MHEIGIVTSLTGESVHDPQRTREGIVEEAADDVLEAGQRVGARSARNLRAHSGERDADTCKSRGIAHSIDSGTAVERVIADIRDDEIIESIAGSVEVCGTRQRQILDIGRYRITHRRDDHVGT